MKLTDIRPDPAQPRKVFDKKHIKGLSESIRQEGLINPIEVDQTGMIITGECRYRAAILLGLAEVPVNMNETDYGEYERLRHQMAENVHQSSSDKDSMMNPIDTAKGYAKLLKLRSGYEERKQGRDAGITALAREIGVAESTIRDYLNLLEEPAYVLHAIEKGLPRTMISSTRLAPEHLKDKFKKKIVAGDYVSRDELRQDIKIANQLPELSLLEIQRQRTKESIQVNRILNHVAALALALEDIRFKDIDIREKGIVTKQLEWVNGEIIAYLNPESN